MRRLLIKAAQDLAERHRAAGHEAGAGLARIYSAEKILAPGEDWRTLGTPADAMVREMEKYPMAEAQAPTLG